MKKSSTTNSPAMLVRVRLADGLIESFVQDHAADAANAELAPKP